MSNGNPMIVSVIVDNESWILPYAQKLVNWCSTQGLSAVLCRTHDEVPKGDVAFYIGCTRITPPEVLQKNKYNLVVHESALPQGRGFAPMAWQILEGQNEIPVCLIEAAPGEADSGAIYQKGIIALKGHELCPEWRSKQGDMTIELCQRFISSFPPEAGVPQKGTPSSYPRRRPADSQLDVNKTIAEQFDLLRIVDNDRYPAHFEYRGHRYILKIEKDDTRPL